MNRVFPLAALLACMACGRRPGAEVHQGLEVPVVINSEAPFQYPEEVFNRGVEGEVRLRLFVDSTGRAVLDSTRIASSSGTPELDSVALSGAAELRFAPARRDGRPIGMAFYLPVVFRRPATAPVAPGP